jgi:ABC-2 type transport system permease protein
VTRLVAAELLKFRTTRAAIGFVLAALALVAIGTAGTVGSARQDRLGTSDLSRELLSGAVLAALIVFLVGIISVTSEWRHGTITRTFLVTPRRIRVVVAKEIWLALFAACIAVVSLGLVVLVAATWLAVDGSPSLVLESEQARQAGRLVLVAVLWGTMGVGVGALVQSQTFAVVGSVIWILIVENLVAALVGLVDAGGVADYLPGRALSAFDGTEGGLSTWAGGAVALGWVVVLFAAGSWRVSRQDVG